MDDLNLRIKELLEQGNSLRKIAVKLEISYGSCRSRAVKCGYYSPSLKKVENDHAVCIKCNTTLPINNFPKLETEGKYVCTDCENEYLHQYQIRKVGCTKEQYDMLFELQEGRCAICGKDYGHTSKQGKKARLAVDHNHETNAIRGLLCGNCNRGLGYLKEKNLMKAVVYCQTH